MFDFTTRQDFINFINKYVNVLQRGNGDTDIINEFKDVAEALQNLKPKVKPLVWITIDKCKIMASPLNYVIRSYSYGYNITNGIAGDCKEIYRTLEEAKEICQNHYAQDILSQVDYD